MMMTLPNSDGCRLKGPTSIQRCEPRVASPAAKTMASEPSSPAQRAHAQRATWSRLTRVATIIATTPTATKRICRSR